MSRTSTSPTLFSDSDPRERERLARAIDRLAGEVLPERADASDRYPVRLDHCFKRIAFDLATGTRWDEVVDRPFHANAPLSQLRSARALLEVMAGSAAATRALNAKSLSFRD